MAEPLYLFTNESLSAIVEGMRPEPNSNILAIAGCGDQCFALLESGAFVTATDALDAQLAFMRERSAMLQTGDFASFLAVPEPDMSTDDFYRCWERRQQYFQEPGRLTRIRNNLSHLTIMPQSLFIDFCLKPEFTHVYLSNLFAYSDKGGLTNLDSIAGELTPGTILYLSGDPEPLPSKLLDLDAERSRAAQRLEPLWTPHVYRRR